MDFSPLVNASPVPKWSKGSVAVILRDNFDISTWLLLGAVAQTALYATIGRIAFLPAFVYLVFKAINTYAMATGLKRNVYMDGVIATKFSAQPPNAQGQYGNKPANSQICVLLIGARSNSPLGLLAPGMRELGDYFMRMNRELEQKATEFGYLGGTAFMGADRSAGNQTLNVMYFRSHEGVHAYAHSPLHREAWDWWNASVAQKAHFGIYHELYSVPSGMWESIYANMAPTGLAATQYRVGGGKEVADGQVKEESWASPIVDARRGILKTSAGRMSRSEGREHEAYGDLAQPYGDVEKQ